MKANLFAILVLALPGMAGMASAQNVSAGSGTETERKVILRVRYTYVNHDNPALRDPGYGPPPPNDIAALPPPGGSPPPYVPSYYLQCILTMSGRSGSSAPGASERVWRGIDSQTVVPKARFYRGSQSLRSTTTYYYSTTSIEHDNTRYSDVETGASFFKPRTVSRSRYDRDFPNYHWWKPQIDLHEDADLSSQYNWQTKVSNFGGTAQVSITNVESPNKTEMNVNPATGEWIWDANAADWPHDTPLALGRVPIYMPGHYDNLERIDGGNYLKYVGTKNFAPNHWKDVLTPSRPYLNDE